MAPRSLRRPWLAAVVIAAGAVFAACSSGDDGPTLEGAAGEGQELVRSKGCMGCHSVDGSRRTGPPLNGLPGSEVELSDGSTLTADRDYIAESIRDPEAKKVDGYSARMPTYDLSDDEIDKIIAYLDAL